MSRLAGMCDELLSTLVHAFAATPNPQAVSYVADGQPALDFGSEDALIVSFDRLRPGSPSVTSTIPPGPFQAAGQVTAELSVWALRAAPTVDEAGNAPRPEDLTAAAHLLLDDAELVMQTVVGALAAGTLFGTCTAAAFTESLAFGPQGGVEGSRMRLAVAI